MPRRLARRRAHDSQPNRFDWLPQKDHPIWTILRPVSVIGALSLFLFVHASSFDAGEAKIIVGSAIVSTICEVLGIKAPTRKT